jgi:ubiquitin C-terminal hydrolase
LNYATDTCHVTEMLHSFTRRENLGTVYACDQCNNTLTSEDEGYANLNHRSSTSNLRLRARTSSLTNSNTNRSTRTGAIRTEAIKKITVSKLPKILRLHLKRFRWLSRNQRDKIRLGGKVIKFKAVMGKLFTLLHFTFL